MSQNQAIEALQKALKRLPSVGPRSAQRMAFHLLERDREGAREIAHALTQALKTVVHCERCNNFSQSSLCELCSSPKRNNGTVCIVETPADLESVEAAGVYQGLYFVLMGHLSPLDGIGPEQLNVNLLISVMEKYEINEIILATNLTMEGEATADYISQLARQRNISVTRLARGLPVGGELEYMDHGTIDQAFQGRKSYL